MSGGEQEPSWRRPLPDAAAAAAVFVILCVVFWRWREVPYYWDGVGYVYPHTREIFDRGLDPILRRYDVGHPPLFYFLCAVAWTLVGPGPFGAHLVTWGFSALLGVAIFRSAREMSLPRDLAWGCSLATLTFPIVFASQLQMQLDLPMTALQLAAIYCWARRRWSGYLLFGAAACLMKLYGFLFVPALMLAEVLTAGRFGEREKRWPLRRALLLTAIPVLAYGVFLLVARWQRGPGLTVNHVPGNTIVPFWDWRVYQAHVASAWTVLFRFPMLDTWLLVAAMLLATVGLALLTSPVRRAEWSARLEPTRVRLAIGLVLVPLTLNAAFFLITGLCSRYNLLLVPVLMLMIFSAAWWLIPRRAVLWPLVVITMGLNVLLWHPGNAAGFPASIRSLVQREPLAVAWAYEIDLRFLDMIRLAQWGPRIYWLGVSGDSANGLFITHWPLNVSYYQREIGYAEHPFPTRFARSWDDVRAIMADPRYAAMPEFYVFTIQPIGDLLDPEGAGSLGFELVGERQAGELTARLYRLRRGP